jgi:tetratricopeptide (TPR) repeat protein
MLKVIFSSLFLLTSWMPLWAQNPQALVQDAMSKQQAGDLQGAVVEYRQFLKLHPEATAIHTNLGAALAGLGRYEEAVGEYKIALRQSPRLPGARLNLALAYYKMGRISDAVGQLVKVHAEDPANNQAEQRRDSHARTGGEEASGRYGDRLHAGDGADPRQSG